MSDSYILDPTFYTNHERFLILAEVGTEYSWGLEAYELAGRTMMYLGPLSVAAWSGENYVNPLQRSKVTSGTEGYRVQFFSDLIVDPGGIHQWTLQKQDESITFSQVDGRFVLDADSVGNQACFFYIEDAGVEPDGRADTSSDFGYFFDQFVPWLDRHRISYSFQTELPLRMIAVGHSEIDISREELQDTLGIVLIARDGRRKELYDVHTDVDLATDMIEFFGLGQ